MKVLYIFPHPDDESFRPAPAISRQVREGHEEFLLTLTRGGATKTRSKYDYSVEQMGQVRYEEMQEVAKVLKLADLAVLGFPDSGLKEVDLRELERATSEHIVKVNPQVVVTYPVHGISGFYDHLIIHSIVKRVFVEMKGRGKLQRLAFYTLNQERAEKAQHHKLSFLTEEEIDCVAGLDEADRQAMADALGCYTTYQEMIEKTGVKEKVGDGACFEIFQEDHKPPLSDLFVGLS